MPLSSFAILGAQNRINRKPFKLKNGEKPNQTEKYLSDQLVSPKVKYKSYIYTCLLHFITLKILSSFRFMKGEGSKESAKKE